MSNKNELVYSSEEQFTELSQNGSIEVNGVTHDYKEGNLYVVEEGEESGSGGKLYRHNILLYKVLQTGTSAVKIGNFDVYNYSAEPLFNDQEDFINVIKKVGVFSELSDSYSLNTTLALDNFNYYYGMVQMSAVYNQGYLPNGQFVFSGIVADSSKVVKVVTQGETLSEIKDIFKANDVVYEL